MEEKLLNRLRESIIGPDRYATLITISPQGDPRARAMTLVQLDDQGRFWFSTRSDTRKVGDIRANPRASLSFRASPGAVNVQGAARIVEDSSRKRELYSPAWNVFGYGGPDDPSWLLIEVEPNAIEFVEAKTRESEAFQV